MRRALQVSILAVTEIDVAYDARMCTIIILIRPEHDWPVLIAANRDERHDRPWLAPDAHWPDRPGVVGGLDLLAEGSWLGVNATGVAAAALNRQGTLGPQDGKRSRGELVLDALDHPDAADAAQALRSIDPRAYRPFNLVVADNRDAFVLIHRDWGDGGIDIMPLPAGLTMVTSMEPNDPDSPRIRLHRPRFEAAPAPDPESGAWTAWEDLLANPDREPGSGPSGALFIAGAPPDDPGRFGTVSSSIIALPSIVRPDLRPIWRFACAASAVSGAGTSDHEKSGRTGHGRMTEEWAWREVALGPRN
jgi:hypothetical protein